MSDLLRRGLAPIPDAAWAEIDDEAVRTLKPLLAARRLVDVAGPLGWEASAVNLGRLDIPKDNDEDGVTWGLRQVLPMVEIRVPFSLDMFELDDVTRGAADADLAPLQAAAKRTAMFEERLVWSGFGGGGIEGVAASSEHEPIAFDCDDADAFSRAVADGVKAIQDAGIDGPYALALGPDAYHALTFRGRGGYPLRRQIEKIADGPIVRSLALKGGIVLSTRGGDFELTLGQDTSIGYWRSENSTLHLYLTQSLTFRVLEPAAAVVLKTA